MFPTEVCTPKNYRREKISRIPGDKYNTHRRMQRIWSEWYGVETGPLFVEKLTINIRFFYKKRSKLSLDQRRRNPLHAFMCIASFYPNPRGKLSGMILKNENLSRKRSMLANKFASFRLQICVGESEIFVSCWTGYCYVSLAFLAPNGKGQRNFF